MKRILALSLALARRSLRFGLRNAPAAERAGRRRARRGHGRSHRFGGVRRQRRRRSGGRRDRRRLRRADRLGCDAPGRATMAGRRVTMAGRRPADAPSGLMITTAIASAPLSIEPRGVNMKKTLSSRAGPGRRAVGFGLPDAATADRHTCRRRDRRGYGRADRIGGFRRQRGRRHRGRPDRRRDWRAGRQRRDGALRGVARDGATIITATASAPLSIETQRGET